MLFNLLFHAKYVNSEPPTPTLSSCGGLVERFYNFIQDHLYILWNTWISPSYILLPTKYDFYTPPLSSKELSWDLYITCTKIFRRYDYFSIQSWEVRLLKSWCMFLMTCLHFFHHFLKLFESWIVLKLFKSWNVFTQHVQWTLNKIENTFNGTFTGWKSMHQGFRIYFVRNPRLMAIEFTC